MAVDRMPKACDNFQLTISTKKTEVVHQSAPGKPFSEPTITVNGQKRQVVDKFTYLGSTLSRAVYIDDEVTARTAKASVAFGRLRTKVWEMESDLILCLKSTRLLYCQASYMHVRPGQYTNAIPRNLTISA